MSRSHSASIPSVAGCPQHWPHAGGPLFSQGPGHAWQLVSSPGAWGRRRVESQTPGCQASASKRFPGPPVDTAHTEAKSRERHARVFGARPGAWADGRSQGR